MPVGNNSLFDTHFQVVSGLRDVPFYELNRPQTSSSQRGPFKHFNWNDGNLLFDFLRYDRVLMGPGELNNFQVSSSHYYDCTARYSFFVSTAGVLSCFHYGEEF